MDILKTALVFLIFNLWLLFVLGKYDIYVRGIRCKHFDPEYVTLKRCEVKAERGRKGVIYGVAIMVKPLDQIWCRLQIFWRGSSGRFQPFVVDLDMEICEVPKYLHKLNPLLQVIKDCASTVVNKEFMTAILSGCPIFENVNISGFEADGAFKSYLPPVIPEGTFKVSLHIHVPKNRTIADIGVMAEVKTLGISDFIKLG